MSAEGAGEQISADYHGLDGIGSGQEMLFILLVGSARVRGFHRSEFHGFFTSHDPGPTRDNRRTS